MALAPGTKLGPYEIQSPLGAGGMGEVYRASDTKLGRDVALKVLPADMAQDPERLSRFRREAKTLAQLDHPSIVTIYSVEECDGIHFLTMQLVEGLPLDRVIPAGGLSVEQIVDIASALGEALAAAHEKGIVHRDLKPANVMVSSEGRVKVLDFGLAKDVRTNPVDATMTSASQTQVGVVMGTPAYMSPEQTSGRPLDHRTDIFSLGVLLHEMSTGQRPFQGNSSAELVSAILRDTAPPVTDLRPDLPSDLARVIRRCLEKDPRHRLQTARDVSNEFRDLARQSAGRSSTQGAPKKLASTGSSSLAALVPDSGTARAEEGFWVAVLPFRCAAGNADLIALAEGLTDDIITNMSKFSYLRVVARTSTARYANSASDLRAVAHELGARYVMEGSLRQAGAKVRIAVQLADASTGAGLWAETYDRAFSAELMLDLLDDVVPRIVATVGDTQGILAHSMTEALRNRDPKTFTPHEALLRSFGFHQHVSAAEHLAGRTALERAVKAAPDHAECWASLSWLYRAEFTHQYNELPDAMDRSLEAARRAVALAPSNQLAHAALASAFFFRKEMGEFRNSAERALSLNKMEGYTTAFLAMEFAFSGDWERGCALALHATQLNPHHPGWYWFPFVMEAYRRGDGQRALDYALKINMPGLWTTQVAVVTTYSQLGETAKAQHALRSLLKLRPDFGVVAREELSKWWQPDLVEQLLGDLQKAGLPRDAAAHAILREPVQAGTSSGAGPTTDQVSRTASGATQADEGFWVALLPLKYSGGDADLTALAEGLTEDIVTGLSRFSYLRVIARSSTARYAHEVVDVRSAGKQLGARYVMEGSLRQAGPRLRLAVQLVDASSGAHLWAETYERAFQPGRIFELQDELVPRIVSTVGDTHGVLPYSMAETLRGKAPNELTPYEALLRGFAYFKHVSSEEHLGVRAGLERAVEQAPGNADCWAMLAMLYREENNHGYNVRPDPVGRALAAARRAVDLAPSNHLAHHALASVLFFRHEPLAFRSAAQRAMELNPMDGFTIAYMGFLLSYAGDWERGCALMEKARNLNPNHPGWYWFPPLFDAYRKGEYREALEYALKVNMPGFWRAEFALAVTYGQLGEQELARNAAQELLAIRPEFMLTGRKELEKWWQPELVEHLIEGLRKAGVDITSRAGAPAAALLSAQKVSGASRADEGFWVGVLPFKYAGSSAELKALADGLSEEVVTGLSRFSYLRVIARGSTLRFTNQAADLRTVGKELGARYVMEGTLRQSGTKLRLAIQLVDAVSGAHLWAENYERSFNSGDLFALQDDLVPRIVSTVADQYGILPRSMSEALRRKSEDELTPHEAVLRAFSYFERINAEEHANVRRILERAVEQAPDQSDCWAMLSMLYRGEYAQGFNPRPDPLKRALAAAQRAVDLAPSNHLAYFAQATSLFFLKDSLAFGVAAERCLALNKMDGSTRAFVGLLIGAYGDWDRGCELVETAMQLNPNHPGWYRLAVFWKAYHNRQYREALDAALRINMPTYFHTHSALAASLGQLAQHEAAKKALQDLLALRPDFAQTARYEYAKWYGPEDVEHILEGLRKAGLQIPDTPEQ